MLVTNQPPNVSVCVLCSPGAAVHHRRSTGSCDIFLRQQTWKSEVTMSCYRQSGNTVSYYFHLLVNTRTHQWCGLRPSVLGQDRSEAKSWSWSCTLWSWCWSWLCRSDVVLWNTILSRSSS